MFSVLSTGGVKLLCNGYEFYKHRELHKRGHTYWRCSKFKIAKCKAKARTIRTANNTQLTRIYGKHSHNPQNNV